MATGVCRADVESFSFLGALAQFGYLLFVQDQYTKFGIQVNDYFNYDVKYARNNHCNLKTSDVTAL